MNDYTDECSRVGYWFVSLIIQCINSPSHVPPSDSYKLTPNVKFGSNGRFVETNRLNIYSS